jgi:acetoin utilization deacetylase AcuC-like enzyme
MGFDYLDSYMDDEITTLFFKKKMYYELGKNVHKWFHQGHGALIHYI